MAVEDVTIRLRVDDSALRRRGRDAFSLDTAPGRNAAGSGLQASAFDSALIGGAAGSSFSPVSINSQPTDNSAIRAVADRQARLDLLKWRKDFTDVGRGDRAFDLGRDAADVARQVDIERYVHHGRMTGYSLTGEGIRPHLDPVHFNNQRRVDVDNYLGRMTPGRHIGRFGTSFQASIDAGGRGILDSDSGIFGQPLGSDTVFKKRSIIGRAASSARDFGARILANDQLQNFISGTPTTVDGVTGRRAMGNSFKLSNFSFDAAKDVAGRVGIVTSAVGAMVVASDMSKARSDYFKKLLLTDEKVDSAYLSMGFQKTMSKIQDTWAKLTMNTMYEVPSILLEGIGNLFGADDSFGLAIDMAGMEWREALGLTEKDYQRVAEQQNAWNKAYTRMKEQVLEQTKRQARDVAARLQGLGLDGVSLADLSAPVYKNMKQPALKKASDEFNDTNPFPSSRSVNPYGVDGSGIWDWGVAAQVLGPGAAFGAAAQLIFN